jgi:hypothetical protein
MMMRRRRMMMMMVMALHLKGTVAGGQAGITRRCAGQQRKARVTSWEYQE